MQNLNQNHKNYLKQRCFKFSVLIVKFCDSLSKENINQILITQLLRAATSIGANIVEAFGSASKKDFSRFFTIALKSSKETLYWLYLLRETGKGDKDLLNELIKECGELSKMIAASILTMQGKR